MRKIFSFLVLMGVFPGIAGNSSQPVRAAGIRQSSREQKYIKVPVKRKPDAERMAIWSSESGRPFMITEFYAKGHDSGLPNNSGAGWLVQTQKDRARFYQHFTLGLLESKSCVGWHWFKYRDNNPEDLSTDPSNRDSNKGIIDYKYKPYVKLPEDMKKLNNELYALIDFFDSK